MNDSHIRGKEDRVLDSALEQLKAVHPTLSVKEIKREPRPGSVFDGEITLQTDKATLQYLLEIKINTRPQVINHVIIKKETNPKTRDIPLLLVADYITPTIAGLLKEAGINYVDTVGNLFLKGGPKLFLYVEGRKPTHVIKGLKTRLFQPSGLTLLFGLLIDPETVNKPYRKLAKENGVALGTVGWVMRDLREHGFLEPSGKKQYRIISKKHLLDQWVQAYARTLRPKVLLGEFGSLAPHLHDVVSAFKTHTSEMGTHWALTGGFGADELIHHYRGQKLSVYVSEWTSANVRELPIVPVENGDITVLRGFSPLVFTTSPKETEYPVVHPLLIYTELLFQGTDRDIETARLLYRNFLEASIGTH